VVPGVKKEPEKKVEQITMPLQFPQRREKNEKAALPPALEPPRGSPVEEAPEPVAAGTGGSGSSSPGPMDFPVFLKPENMRKEPRTYVSKGSVMTQYEDDMDYPTFLRKQMQ
jgi:hypothetical protein